MPHIAAPLPEPPLIFPPPGFPDVIPDTPNTVPLITVTNAAGGVEPFYIPTWKQLELHLSPYRNTLYGGRAGTGKSVGLRMDGHMRCLVQRDYRALLVRRQMTELRDTHIDKLNLEAEALGARYRASETTVLYPTTNARFRFGHVEDDAALKQYLSSEFDIIYFDEGATFTEFQFRFLCSRLRSVKTGVKAGVIPMVRVGSNPGAMWLHDYFISKDVDAERDPGYNPKSYHFIPATILDNPHADADEYDIRLNSLPTEALRRMYRDGDWLAVEGQFYDEWRPLRNLDERMIPWHVIHEIPRLRPDHDDTSRRVVPFWEIPWIEVVRAVDWGYSELEPGICLWFAMMPSGAAIGFQEFKFDHMKPEDVSQEIKRRSVWPNDKAMKVRYTVGDPRMFHHETGESIAETFAKKKNGGISMLPGDHTHPNGFTRVHSWLKTEYMGGTVPYPALRFLSPSPGHPLSGCPYTIKTFPMLTRNPLDPSKIGSHQPDHGADATKYFVMSRPALSREPVASLNHLPPYIRKAILRGQPHRQRLGVESVRGRR